ncbi:AMP-binding protein [Actinocorallia sp. A-T 12471]|uniref:AMP-binding protein n=1 Tax=Actinocorallia sp. A-T 12471 TaxID=3089813 RepID=UPI0029CF0DA2|nr:AMP-binding protein [Actinocorallia sp. A-T 12471]MDX6741587.1 AMP-binding protein [Actinocorallia sp. A-T 12471]
MAHVDKFCAERTPAPHDLPRLSFDLPELRYPELLNCAAVLLDEAVARFGPDRRCLVTEDAVLTYGDLDLLSGRIARVLADDLGIVPGNRVLLRGANSPWLVAAWLGVLKAGAVAVTTMPLLRAHELAAITQIARPSAALCDHRATGELAGVPVVAFGGDAPDDLAARCAGREPLPAVPTDAAETALLAFTSGTTGRPKATLHCHRDVLAIADTFSAHVLKPVPDDLFLGTPPIGFTFGLGGLVVFPLRAGASVYLGEPGPGAGPLAETVERVGATVLFTAPTVYRALLEQGLAGRLSGLRRAVSAGEHLPERVWHAFHEATGIRLIDGIGATEMLHVFISAADGDIRPGATGLPVPGYRARIVDEDLREVPDGVPGLLAVQGPTGCRYLDDPRQRAYVRDGWNLTGDVYVRDADGYFWYQARSDDMIVSAGYNIAGPEVERAVLDHPAVLDCGVAGVPDPGRGMIVKAFVVLRPGVPETAETARGIQEFVKRSIAPYKYPRAVEFRAALPRSSNGKLLRRELRPAA